MPGRVVTYKMHVMHGAPVDVVPPDDAIVARPGPLLADVKAELARLGAGAQDFDRIALLDRARIAFDEEAADIVAHDDLEMCAPSVPSVSASRGESDLGGETHEARKAVVVRHRMDARPKRRETAARLVVLRDRRRGRPSHAQTKHGSDPPD